MDRTPKREPLPPSQSVVVQNAPTTIGFTLDGQWYSAGNARGVLVKLLQQLNERDPNFLERFAALPKHGHKVRFVARSIPELNPARPDLANTAREVAPGWWAYVHLSRENMVRIIQIACEVAGLQYGTDVRINLGS